MREDMRRVAEVAYRFAPRDSGRSKASLSHGLMFVRHLVMLAFDTTLAAASLVNIEKLLEISS